jgi:hypothetical protein
MGRCRTRGECESKDEELEAGVVSSRLSRRGAIGLAAGLAVLAFGLSVVLGGAPRAAGTDDKTSSRLLHVFARSNIYPELFDEFVDDHPDYFDEKTRSCVRTVGKRFSRMAQEHLVACYTIHDPFTRGQCKANNPAAVIAEWCIAILERLDGKSWCSTDYGSVSCKSKAEGDATRYEQVNQALLAMVQPLLVCP